MLLTVVNLLLRLVGTSFQVFLSNQIGAAGIGLLQLVMSVGGLAVVAGVAGIRTATMYLTAEELGKNKPHNIIWILSGCFLYSILCSGSIALLLYKSAPWIAQNWVNDSRTVYALQLFAAFLPIICLCNVMVGYFTAANRISTLAIVEVAEQLVSMVVTLTSLFLWAGRNPIRACMCVILGSCISAGVTLLCLIFLQLNEKPAIRDVIPVRRRIESTAIPLALADILKSGINTVENLMVPKRLALNLRTANPLADFGMVNGMVFPVLMFPACILFGLNELLIPELARCAAAGGQKRISYLIRRSLRIALLYGLLFSGLEFLLADWLCFRLYQNDAAGQFLKLYSLLIPMLYCDAITDAMTKGLGQQKICVRYNILTSALDVLFLYLLLPAQGMTGYFISFTVTHLINFILSLRLLLKIAGESIPFYIPALAISASLLAGLGACTFASPLWKSISYIALWSSLLYLFRVAGMEDIRWIRGLICKK